MEKKWICKDIKKEDCETPTFTILIGIPGSGKSTWIKENSKGYEIVCPDDIRTEICGDISDQSKNNEVWKLAKERIIEFLKNGKSVILDATNVNTKLRIQFMKDLPKCNKIAILFRVSPDVAFKRITEDILEHKDRSNVPEEVIYRMYGEYLYTEKVIREENFDEIKYL